MSRKRYRTPKAKPGELKVSYGKMPYEDPDVIFTWGEDEDTDKHDVNC